MINKKRHSPWGMPFAGFLPDRRIFTFSGRPHVARYPKTAAKLRIFYENTKQYRQNDKKCGQNETGSHHCEPVIRTNFKITKTIIPINTKPKNMMRERTILRPVSIMGAGGCLTFVICSCSLTWYRVVSAILAVA